MPWPDRTVEEWKAELGEDWRIIRMQIMYATATEADEKQKATGYAVAAKEARRMLSDIYRMAEKDGVSREQIDAIRT